MRKLNEVELELTSKCNAACPACKRTQLNIKGKLEINDIVLTDLQKAFETIDLEDADIRFCGILGDPCVHNDIESISKYFIDNKKARVNIYTNGGMQTPKFWANLGYISKINSTKHRQGLTVKFAVDGLEDTNHLYRRNVNWGKVWANMTAYSQAGGFGIWNFVIFKHNEHQIDQALKKAKELNFNFFTKSAWRNSDPLIIPTKLKTQEHKGRSKPAEKINILPVIEGSTLYTQKESTKDIEQKITKKNYKMVRNDLKNVCKWTAKTAIYIGSDNKVWPCCYFGNETANEKSVIKNKIGNAFGNKWNDIKQKSIEEILSHEYFNIILEESWQMDHPLHIPTCYKYCGDNGRRSNAIITERLEKNNAILDKL